MLCKVNAPHQVFESCIRTERIETGIDFEIDQPNYYDGNNNGNPALGLNLLGWTSDGWPYVQ